MAQKLKTTITNLGKLVSGNTADVKPGTISVIYGVHNLEALKLEGKTVGDVKKQLSNALNIDPQAENVIAGETVSDEHVLKEKDVLEFVKTSGSKG